MKNRSTLLLLFLSAAFILPQNIKAQFIFDVAGATSTTVTGINDSNDIVGYCTRGGVNWAFAYIHGDTLFYQRNSGNNTWFGGINNKRIIGGNYNTTGSTANNIPFIYNYNTAQATDFTDFGGWNNISVNGINDKNQISGSMQSGSTREIFTDSINGTLNDIKYRDHNLNVYPTYGGHINNKGQTTGYYINGSAYTGFIYDGGSQLFFDTMTIVNAQHISKLKLNGGNDANEYTSEYNSLTGYRFLYDDINLAHTFVRFMMPNSAETNPLAINNRGYSCGYWVDSFGTTHGFYEGDYSIGYRPNPNGFVIVNSDTDIWPSTDFVNTNYSHDPVLGGSNYFPTRTVGGAFFYRSSFPSWGTWVDVFGMNQCYITNTISGHKVLNPNAQMQWASIADTGFAGACFGMANLSLQSYDDYTAVTPRFPNAGITSPVLTGITAGDSIRRAILASYTSQFSSEYQNQIIPQFNSYVNTIFNNLKSNMADTIKANNVILSIILQNGVNGSSAGGHALVPYYITKRNNGIPGTYNILIYNCNSGANVVDTMTINIYTYGGKGSFLWHSYGGWSSRNAWALTQPPYSLQTNLHLTSNVLPPHTPLISRGGVQGLTRLAVCLGDHFKTTNSVGQYIAWDGTTTTDSIDNGMLMPRLTGYETTPRNMYVPADNYTIQTTKTSNTAAGLYTFTNTATYYLQRYNALTNDIDNFTLSTDNSPGYNNTGGANRMLRIEVAIDTNQNHIHYIIDSLTLGTNNTIGFQTTGLSDLQIFNNGAPTTYHLQVDVYNDTSFTTFIYPNVPIGNNTSHTIHQTNPGLATGEWIYVDSGQNGSIDDTIFYQNQASPTLSLSKNSAQLPAVSGTDTIGVGNTGGGNFTWHVTSAPAWVTVTAGDSGINQGKIIYNYTANTGGARSGYIVVTAAGAANSPDSVLLNQDGFVGIANNEIGENDIEVYPNPANNYIQLKTTGNLLKDAVIVVYDMTGKVVLQTTSESASNMQLNIDPLETGTYIIAVKTGTALFRKQVVVIK